MNLPANENNLYKPDRIRVLLIGESASTGGPSFYESSNPFSGCIRRAFERALGIQFEDDREFYTFFRARGFFSDSLVHQRLDGEMPSRTKASYIPELAERIKTYQPQIIVVCLKEIWLYVAEAIDQSGVEPTAIYPLSFQCNGHRQPFIKKLANVLAGII